MMILSSFIHIYATTMKQITVLLILFFFLIVKSQAQVNSPRYHIGPKVGFNVYKSRFEFKEDEELYDQSIKTGYQIGAMIDLPLKKSIFHFHSELYYSKKGKKTKIISTGLTNDATYHFIEAPILLRVSMIGGNSAAGKYKYHFDIGPTISYWLGGKGKLYADGPESKYKIKFGDPVTSEFDVMYITNPNRVQWGLAIGAGVDYPIVKHQFVYIDIRAGLGSTNLGKHNSEANIPILGFSDSMDVRFLEFMISVAYAFEIDWIQTRKGKSTINKRQRR